MEPSNVGMNSAAEEDGIISFGAAIGAGAATTGKILLGGI